MTSQPRPDQVRLVPITGEQCDAIENMLAQFYDLNRVGDVPAAWDAAPADAAEAVHAAMVDAFTADRENGEPLDIETAAEAGMRALGYPHTEQA